MKKLFQGKQKKKRKKKVIFFLFMLLIGVIISYYKLSTSNIKISDKEIAKLITDYTFTEDNSIIELVINKTLEINNPIKKLNQDYKRYLIKEIEEKEEVIEEPTIYLYNTHQTEEYAPSDFVEFSINPTVIINNYILHDIFLKNSINSIVEESSIKNILNQNSWNYSNSYKASRILMEEAKNKYPSLEYFIDIHRDSLSKDKTTISIEGKDYAKILFIVGMENPNYEENLAFTEKIQNKIETYYPSLSKGIYKKSGYGVNGIYNQDFSNHTILIEIGGYENTTSEVLNSSLAFAKCFMEVLHE